MTETYICKIKPPVKCENYVQGKLSFVNLCGGNDLDKDVKACCFRQKVKIILVPDDKELGK